MTENKAALRKIMAERRNRSVEDAGQRLAQRRLAEVLKGFSGKVVSGYAAMRSEIDPFPALALHNGPCCLPVVQGRGLPLTFRAWRPGAALIEGAYGARIPAAEEELVPEVVIVPLLAFDGRLQRLGYGGGFYDRTLEQLRGQGKITAIGFAWDAQFIPEVPTEPVDQPLDMVVTPTNLWRGLV